MRTPSLLFLTLLLAGCSQPKPSASGSGGSADEAFNRLVDDYIAGYLAWRPQTGTTLGLHEYDGKVTDFSRASLDAELARLNAFDHGLAELDAGSLSPQASFDYRILRGAIRREMFNFDQ